MSDVVQYASLSLAMTAIHAVGPRSADTQTTESVLRHFYVIIAIAIVFVLLILRVIVLRRRNQALSDFFRIGSSFPYGSYPPYDSNYGAMFHGIQLAPPPAAYHRDGRIRAADTDAHGRRLGSAGEECQGKDELPAYNNVDRPPKYIEAGWSQSNPSQPTEQSAAVAIPSIEGEPSGMAHSNTTYGVPGDNVDHPHDGTHVVHGSEAQLPPPHRNLPDS